MMTTSQINTSLRGTKYFLGAFPSDAELPVKEYPATVIFNTDGSGDSGEHWVAVHLKGDGYADYCDSFGFPPLINATQRFLWKHGFKLLRYNRVTIQRPSETTCGDFAMKYVRHVAAGGDLTTFVGSHI